MHVYMYMYNDNAHAHVHVQRTYMYIIGVSLIESLSNCLNMEFSLVYISMCCTFCPLLNSEHMSILHIPARK